MKSNWSKDFGSLEELVPEVMAVLDRIDEVKPAVHSQIALKKALALRLDELKPGKTAKAIHDHSANIVAHIHAQWTKQAGIGVDPKNSSDPGPILNEPLWLATFTAKWGRRAGLRNKWDIFRRGSVSALPVALYINGAFKTTLEEIEKTQQSFPGKVCYLQPYASERIKLLADSQATPEHPITLYLSLTDSLPCVSYRAKIVGWRDKRELAENKVELASLNRHIKDFQPSENSIFLTTEDGKPCVNLISVVDVTRMETKIPVSCFIKTSDLNPLKKRTVSGGWCPVHEQFEWFGANTQAVKDDNDTLLQAEVERSLKDSAIARAQRLAVAAKLPESIQVISRAFRRNPDVIAEVLLRAKGICEECNSPAPFLRAANGSPYLEVHHRKLLSAQGEDTVDNAIALCPNCHRMLHFGKVSQPG